MILDRVIMNQLGCSNPFGFAPKEFIGTAIGAGLSVASSVIGGIKSAQANAKAEKEMKAQNARNNAWYTRRYNEDYLDTAAGQNLMRQAKDYADKNWKRQQGAQAVGGGTDAATAMAKEAGNRMIGDTVANIASADVQRKDNVDRIHQNMENNYSQQQVALAQQKAANIANVASSASDALMSVGSAFDTAPSATKTNTSNTAGDVTNPQIRTNNSAPTGSVLNTDLSGKVGDTTLRWNK